MCDINFGRSFLRFSTDHSNHTPRLDVDAVCTVDGKQYALTCECIGEKMYCDTGLIHDPVAEFNLIAEAGAQLMLLKRHADGGEDIRSLHRFGDKMPTRDGQGATIQLLDVSLARCAKVVPIETYDAFHDALHNDKVVNARTTYTDDDGVEVVMEYPCRTINAHNDEPRWQVDAGPVLMTVGGAVEHELPIARLDMAFMVYNRFDYAEAVLRRGDVTLQSANQYGVRRMLDCLHEIFVVE